MITILGIIYDGGFLLTLHRIFRWGLLLKNNRVLPLKSLSYSTYSAYKAAIFACRRTVVEFLKYFSGSTYSRLTPFHSIHSTISGLRVLIYRNLYPQLTSISRDCASIRTLALLQRLVFVVHENYI